MAPRQTQSTPTDTGGNGAGTQPPSFRQLVEMARGSTSRHRFLREALACMARALRSPYATISANYDSEVVSEEFHSGRTSPTFWREPVRDFLAETLADGKPHARLLSARKANLQIAILSAPLPGRDGGNAGGLALVCPANATQVGPLAASLEAVATLTAHLANTLGQGGEGRRSTGSAGQAMAHAATMESPEELAFSITNNLRNKLGCAQVALGLVRGPRVKIVSISGLDDVRRRSPGAVQISAAMEECLDAGVPLAAADEQEWAEHDTETAYRLHRQWRKGAGGAAVASIPIRVQDKITAILSLRRSGADGFRREQIEQIGQTVEPFISAMQLVAEARRGLLAHAGSALGGSMRATFEPRRWGRRLFGLLMLSAAAWFCLGTLPYEVKAPCTLVPALQRHVAMPYDGILVAQNVVAGDRVSAGEILCELDHRELDLQREELLSQLAITAHEHERAMADETPVAAQLAIANERLLRAQLAIVEHQIKQAVVRSPLDGVIVSGDLRHRVGGPIAQGEPLFEIATLDGWTLELEIPESASAELTPGLTGRFASNARPEQAEEFTLTRLRPSAEIRNTSNIFVAEAEAGLNADWLRPGLQGTAKLSCGHRPAWWVTLHSVIDYLHLTFWL